MKNEPATSHENSTNTAYEMKLVRRCFHHAGTDLTTKIRGFTCLKTEELKKSGCRHSCNLQLIFAAKKQLNKLILRFLLKK